MTQSKHLIKHTYLTVLKRTAVVLMSAVLLFGTGILSYAAETGGSTVTLSGHKTETITIGPDTQRVILDGLDMAEKTMLLIDSEAVLEIADGSSNHLDLIEADGAVNVTGGGDLELLSGIIGMRGSLIFNHTGKITSSGPIACADGNLTINSGTIEIRNETEYASGLVTLGGDLVINGGNVQVDTSGASIAAYRNMELNGGEVNATSSESCALMSMAVDDGTITIASGVSGSDGLSVEQHEGSVGPYYTVVSGGKEADRVELNGPADEGLGSSAQKDFDAESAERTRERAEQDQTEEEDGDAAEESHHSVDPFIIVIIVVAVCVAAAAIVAFVVTRKKRR